MVDARVLGHLPSAQHLEHGALDHGAVRKRQRWSDAHMDTRRARVDHRVEQQGRPLAYVGEPLMVTRDEIRIVAASHEQAMAIESMPLTCWHH